MGEVADMMLDGTLCQDCGVYIEDESFGVPRSCSDCERQTKLDEINRGALELAAAQTHKTCRQCGKRVKWDGLSAHLRDKHGQV